jgi:homogentisate phytyltransferase / homogentisate geranylgeranyltransferase
MALIINLITIILKHDNFDLSWKQLDQTKENSHMLFLSNLWQFSRPHTIIGTTLSVIALYLIAIATNNISINTVLFPNNLQLILGAWLACICGNIYIVGLNQLYDIEIDRVNKPHLPLASGAFSIQQGKWIIGITGILSVALSAICSPWLLATVIVSIILGTAYSAPPIRLKRFSLMAAFCILVVRGLVVNVGLFTYFNEFLTQTLSFPPIAWIITLFILVFTIAIAIFKDVPDMAGDQKFQIQTFTISWGKPAVLNITRGVISIAYISMMAAGIWLLPAVNTAFLVGFHGVLLILLWWRSRDVDLEDQGSIASFYQFIWKLFFLEYLLFPLACFIPV